MTNPGFSATVSLAVHSQLTHGSGEGPYQAKEQMKLVIGLGGERNKKKTPQPKTGKYNSLLAKPPLPPVEWAEHHSCPQCPQKGAFLMMMVLKLDWYSSKPLLQWWVGGGIEMPIRLWHICTAKSVTRHNIHKLDLKKK